MLLLMSWTNEKEDMKFEFEFSADHYQSKKTEIEETFTAIMKHEYLVQEALTHIEEFGPSIHVWDQIAPETYRG